MYQNKFIENLKLYSDVENFLKFCKHKNIKLYCLSNNTSKEQIQRINSLNLLQYFECIYTSEDFGIEKPDSKIYYSILSKINCKNNEIAMIGDSYNNDIYGANCANIYAFWFNKKFHINEKNTEFDNYRNLLNFFEKYYEISNNFLKFSKYVGERFDLVQAGGGNTSFKYLDYLFIKSSGCSLSDLKINTNYVGVNYKNIKINLDKINSHNKKIREKDAEKYCKSSITFLKSYRPSIETTMHSLTKKYTVHLHPIQFNLISGLANCEEYLKKIFENFCFINYLTPGIDVALEIKNKYKNEDIIFLKNHGIVFTSDNVDNLYELIEETVNKLENYLRLDYKKYKFVNYISLKMEDKFNDSFVTYLSEDIVINNFINNNILNENHFKSFFPDKLVYCGNNFLKINENFENDLGNYVEQNNEIPKIFVKNINDFNYLYVSSSSLKKCVEIESVLKSHFICYNFNNQYLISEEVKYLNDWDAEKYRKNC